MNQNIDTSLLRSRAVQAVQRLQQKGFIAYWAGGSVRDMIMEKRPSDYDIATDAKPDQVMALFPGSLTVGKQFAVVRAPLEGSWFEIATFRTDHSYRDGRRPESVSFSTPAEDAARRDFTINAIFYDPVTKRLHDFFNGQSDIEGKIVRSVGEAAKRIGEDHLRMLRAVRFASVLGFSLDPELRQAIQDYSDLSNCISAERVRDELTRIFLESRLAGKALRLLDDTGLLKVLLPEVVAMKGVDQPPRFHPEGDVFTHTALMLDIFGSRSKGETGFSREQETVLAWSALLHDIGKPSCARHAKDRIRFHSHDAVGAEMATAILRRLRFPNSTLDAISHCIGNHMRFMHVQQMRAATLRRLLAAPTFPVELELHRLDCLASHGDTSNCDYLEKYQREYEAERELPTPWLNGNDIMAMGVPAGPEVGRWRSVAFDAQLDGRFDNRDELARWIEEEMHKSGIASR